MVAFIQETLKQVRRLIPTLLVIYIPVGLVLFSLFLVWLLTDYPIKELTRDPLAVLETALLEVQRHPEEGIHAFARLELPFFVGIVSNLGILLWCSAVCMTWFAACFLWCEGGAHRAHAWFLLAGGGLSFLLMLDDLLLLHERALPIYFGISEVYLFAVYGLAVLGYGLVFLKRILATDYVLLGLAFVGFAGSLAVDLLPMVFPVLEYIPQSHFFEDGAKFAGVATWAAYHIRCSAQCLRVQDIETLV